MAQDKLQKHNEEVVFDKYWFQKHQSKILWLANSWIGKYIFQFKKMGHYLENHIVKITPNSVAEFLSVKGDEIELKEHFFNYNEYAKKLYFYLLPVWYLMHAWDWIIADHKWFDKWQLAPQLSFGFDTLTQYPGSIGANDPVDGVVSRTTVDETWTTIVAGAGKGTGVGIGYINIRTIATATSNQFERIERGIICFDTSALTAGATISAVVLSIRGTGKTNGLGSPDLHVCSATPANTNNLVNADYGQLGTTSFGNVAYADYSITGYNDITLNASGISNISKTGISKFGTRLSWDINNNFTGTWASGANSRLSYNAVAFGSNFPTLVVTYTVAVGPANLKSRSGNIKANIKSMSGNLIANVKSLDTNV